MGPSAQIRDRRADLIVERRLSEALSETHPEFDDVDELRAKIRQDYERSRGEARSNERADR